MKTILSVTLADILSREQFKRAKILTGTDYLEREINWVHVIEVEDVERCIDGGELILTTGLRLRDHHSLYDFVKKLIEFNAAALCIELGSSVKAISENVLQLANSHNFPIIVFSERVRFLEITRDIHRLLLAKERDAQVLKGNMIKQQSSDPILEKGIDRMLLPMIDNGQLAMLVDEYLGVLIQYDKEKNSQLLLTLKKYFECACAKQETADQLYIVRQTLYHRLKKISQLLGDDFANVENRLPLEMAIRGYELLGNKIN